MTPDMQVDTDSGSFLPNVQFRISHVLSDAAFSSDRLRSGQTLQLE